jgi:hypothetical protein
MPKTMSGFKNLHDWQTFRSQAWYQYCCNVSFYASYHPIVNTWLYFPIWCFFGAQNCSVGQHLLVMSLCQKQTGAPWSLWRSYQSLLRFLVLVLIPYHLVGALPMRAYLRNQYSMTWIRKTEDNFSNTPQWVLTYMLIYINMIQQLSMENNKCTLQQSVNPNEPEAGAVYHCKWAWSLRSLSIQMSLELGQSIHPNESEAWAVYQSKWAWSLRSLSIQIILEPAQSDYACALNP